MFCKVCVMDLGDIDFFLGIFMDILDFIDVNKDIVIFGGIFVISCFVFMGIIKVFFEINLFLLVVFF